MNISQYLGCTVKTKIPKTSPSKKIFHDSHYGSHLEEIRAVWSDLRSSLIARRDRPCQKRGSRHPLQFARRERRRNKNRVVLIAGTGQTLDSI